MLTKMLFCSYYFWNLFCSFLRCDAGCFAAGRNLINEGVLFGSNVIRVRLIVILHAGLSFTESADGQADLLLLVVDVGDLDINILANGELIFRLADAAVGDLRNVDQAINAGHDLGKSTEGHQLDNLDVHNAADFALLSEHSPGIRVGILVAQGDLALLLIEADNIDIQLITDGNDVRIYQPESV